MERIEENVAFNLERKTLFNQKLVLIFVRLMVYAQY